MTRLRRALRIWSVLLLFVVAGFALALAVGSSGRSLALLGEAIANPGSSLASDIIFGLRLPRALAAFTVGALLALAGALMQVLLRNPLADPYVLGVAGGAAVGALGAMLLSLAPLFVTLGAAAGALLAMLAVFGFARHDLRALGSLAADASPRLLLIGVMVAAACGAIVTLILTLAPETRLRGMLFWLMGDLAGAESPVVGLLTLAAVLLLVYPQARSLNVLLHGEDTAQALGVPIDSIRRKIYLAASAATAVAVTIGGAIGFIGLIVPHLLRLAFGNDQRILLPAAVLAGGATLLFADTLARTVVAPQQLPVGMITVIIGVPVFMGLLARRPS